MSCLRCATEKDFFGSPVYKKQTCWEHVKWFCRRNRACFLVAWVVALAAGVGLIVGAAAMVAGGQKSTTGEHYWDRLAAYQHNDVADFTATTVTSASSSLSSAASSTFFVNRSTVTWGLVGPNGTDVRSFEQVTLVGTMPRSSRRGGEYPPLTISLALQQGSVSSNVQTVAFDYVRGGAELSSVCVVVSHSAVGGPWSASTAYPTCVFPFTAAAGARYGQHSGTHDPITIVITSSYNPVLWLQEKSTGDLTNVPDTEVLLVDPNMPTLLGLGCALLVTGAVLLPYFCCCVVPPEADEVAPWEVESAVAEAYKTDNVDRDTSTKEVEVDVS